MSIENQRTINGCVAVNDGIVVLSNDKWIPSVEILSHTFHNPGYNILCTYYYDRDIGAKVEVALCKNIESGRWSVEVCFFHTRRDLQHYRSYWYDLSDNNMPIKYKATIVSLRMLYDKINFSEYVKAH